MEKIFIGAWKDKRGIAMEDVSIKLKLFNKMEKKTF